MGGWMLDMSPEEIAEHLRVPVAMVKCWESSGRIPYPYLRILELEQEIQALEERNHALITRLYSQ